MLENLDPIVIARIQFAFTIGLASWLAVVEWSWLRTGNPIYREIHIQS